jgi:peroxiredoxin
VKKALLILAAGFLLLGWAVWQHSTKPRITGPRPAPAFTLTDLSGRTVSLSDYRGKVVVLDFWATWCEPCKQEIPHFIEMQDKYASQGLQVLGVSMDDDEPPVRQFQQQFKMNYPVALGNPKLADQYGGILGLPITFVIDRNGQVTARHVGATEPSVIEAEVQKLLAQAQSQPFSGVPGVLARPSCKITQPGMRDPRHLSLGQHPVA